MSDVDNLVKETKQNLSKYQNCALCHIVPTQEHFGATETDLKKAVTGLAGGLNNYTSTCGAIYGGAINLALIREATNNQDMGDVELLKNVNEYVSTFKESFGSSYCRDLLGLNLRSRIGQLQLLLPWKKNVCMTQAEFGIRHVMAEKSSNSEITEIPVDHCSTKVWEIIKDKTGYEDKYLERISQVFTGGMGLSGNACGALSALIMYYGVKHRKLEIGTNQSVSKKSAYANVKNAGNEVIDPFIDEFGGIECQIITNTKFNDIEEFNEYRSNTGCQKIYDFLNKYIS